MKKSFSLSRDAVLAGDQTNLLAEIVRETGSESEAQSIIRSLERMGTDPSILAYDMTLETRTGRSGGVVSSIWRVRADRGVTPEAELPE